MTRLILYFVTILVSLSQTEGTEGPWPTIPPGTYLGYADMFAIIKGDYILDNGCVTTGAECELIVSNEGISFNTWFYKWDSQGLQASRTTENGEYERINILGKTGQITIADIVTEKPKGVKVSLIRMTIAPKE